jgi:hypothetical protein
MEFKSGGVSRAEWKARVLKESLRHPNLGRRALYQLLAAEGGPSEATIGKYLRKAGLSKKGQRLATSPESSASAEPRVGEFLCVWRLSSEVGDPSARTMLLGFDQASAFAFIAYKSDSLRQLLEELDEQIIKMVAHRPSKIFLDRKGDRYFKVPDDVEDFAKAHGISLQLEGRWGRNLFSHRRRLEAIWSYPSLSVEGTGTLEERIINWYNFKVTSHLPPCCGRTPYKTFLDLRRRYATRSGDRP